MKKLLSLVLALCLLLSLCAFTASAEEKAPEVTWLLEVGTTSDEDNLVLQEIEKRIGVRVKPIQCSTGDFTAKLNALIASRDLPDMFPTNLTDAKEFIAEGMLQPLDDLLPEYGQNILTNAGENLTEAPANRIDGSTYMVVSSKSGYVNNYAIRADWLKKLGMEVPTNLDELYDVLYAFTYKDPDGNGKDDTVGLVLTMTQSPQWEPIFGAYGIAYGANALLEDGTVTTYMKHPRYLDAVKYLRRLYQDGVMDPEFATMPAMTAHEALWTGRCGTYGFQAVGTTNNWYPGRYTFECPEDPAEIFTFARIVGPDGFGGSPKRYPNLTGGLVVASTAEHPEAVVKLIDFLYTPEGDELTYLGVEDVMFKWTDKENGKFERLPGYEDDAAHRAAGGFTFWAGLVKEGTEKKTMNKLTREAQAFDEQYAFDWPMLQTSLDADAEYGSTLRQITAEALAQLIVTKGDVEQEYADFVARWENEGGREWEEQATAAYAAQK